VEVSEPLPLPVDSEVEKAEAELIPEDNKVKNVVEDLKLVNYLSMFRIDPNPALCFLLILDTGKT
jgi:hypothetical protein